MLELYMHKKKKKHISVEESLQLPELYIVKNVNNSLSEVSPGCHTYNVQFTDAIF